MMNVNQKPLQDVTLSLSLSLSLSRARRRGRAPSARSALARNTKEACSAPWRRTLRFKAFSGLSPKTPISLASAFTLVELLIVIVVIAILAAITVVAYNGITNRAQEASLTSDTQSLEQKLQATAALNGNGTYDSSLNWNSNDGPNSALGNFQASNGETIIVSVASDGSSYCIRAYKPGTTYSNLANALTKGQCDMAPIAVGNGHACAIAGNAVVYCWGYNLRGQLGDGTTSNSSTPVAVVLNGLPGSKQIKALALMDKTSCMLTWDGYVYCWGANDNGQLGVGTTDSNAHTAPVAVNTGALIGKIVKAISGSLGSTCAIASDNNAYCWGSNAYGQLGNGTTTDSSVPVAVDTSGALVGKTVKTITVGLGSTCALASDNNAYCWGINVGGIPVAVTTTGALAGKTVKAISTGSDYDVCAIASDNNAYCWGKGSVWGELGNGTTTNSSVPVLVAGALVGKTVKAIAAGGSSVCVLASDTNNYCWGSNTYGQLGSTSVQSGTLSNVPVQVQLPSS